MTRKACHCPPWSGLDRWERDYHLADLTEWAWAIHHVDLTLRTRGDHVIIGELVSMQPGQGRARHVMEELCRRADCSRITLELNPTNDSDADLPQLATSLGFEDNVIRYPIKDHSH